MPVDVFAAEALDDILLVILGFVTVAGLQWADVSGMPVHPISICERLPVLVGHCIEIFTEPEVIDQHLESVRVDEDISLGVDVLQQTAFL